jgi:hypothetical protein
MKVPFYIAIRRNTEEYISGCKYVLLCVLLCIATEGPSEKTFQPVTLPIPRMAVSVLSRPVEWLLWVSYCRLFCF